MSRMSYVLLSALLIALAWGFVQTGCAPKEPCHFCRADELCDDNNNCVPLPAIDGGTQDGKIGDGVVADNASGDGIAPTDISAACANDTECAGNLICKEGRCIAPDEIPVTGDSTNPPDAGGSDTPPADRTTTTDAPPSDKAQTGDTPPSDQANPETPPGDRAAPDQPACTKDGDCASTHECKAGQCVRKPPPCDPACPTGATCTNGTCERIGSTPDLGELCGPQSKCKAGLECLETDRSSSYCHKPCADSTECKGNPLGEACVQLTQTQRYCVDVVALGDPCGFKEKLQALCPSQSICSEGTCKKPQEVRRYDQCGVNAQVCPTKMICLRFGGAAFGYCVDPCTPGPTATCPDSGECITLSGGSGACIPSGTGKHDTLCGGSQTGPSLDRAKICKPGLECVQLSQAICMEFWDGDCQTAGKTCPSGRICQSLVGGGSKKFGACFSECKQDMCAETHLECRKNQSNSCWPKTP